jgi:hypothetical protein
MSPLCSWGCSSPSRVWPRHMRYCSRYCQAPCLAMNGKPPLPKQMRPGATDGWPQGKADPALCQARFPLTTGYDGFIPPYHDAAGWGRPRPN